MTMQDSKAILKKSGVVLDEDETLEVALEAELWAGSSNPIARFFGACARIISLILGTKKYGFIIITNKRILEVSKTTSCWIFNSGKEVKNVLPSSVTEVGYTAHGTFCGCLCQAYYLYYEACTQKTSILLKGANEEEAASVATAVYDLIAKYCDDTGAGSSESPANNAKQSVLSIVIIIILIFIREFITIIGYHIDQSNAFDDDMLSAYNSTYSMHNAPKVPAPTQAAPTPTQSAPTPTPAQAAPTPTPVQAAPAPTPTAAPAPSPTPTQAGQTGSNGSSAGNSPNPTRLVPDHAVKYPKFKHYTWLIFRDTLLNKPCFIVTNSKYPMLQEYRWCIPFSGVDDDINDSFHGSVAMNYADRKICKEGSTKEPSNGESRYTYCSRMFSEVKQQAERENWASFSEICRTNYDSKIQEFCGYMF